MIIGLMGFEFKSPNKGCEALVYSFISMIEDYLSDDSIIYNFTGTELGLIPAKYSKIKFVNVQPKVRDIRMKFVIALHKCDYVFDVTMGDSFSDIYSKDFYNGLIKHKRIAELFSKKYILLPQTYGPFEFEESLVKAKKVLKKAYKIYCRDKLSQDFLADKISIRDSILSTDMAFILPYNKDSYCFSNSRKMGINVSGLLYKGGFNKQNQFGLSIDYPCFIDKLISEFNNDYEIHLIPHVIDLMDNAYDDDYKICKVLHEKYPGTKLAPAFNSPIEAKSYISNMDIFVGSRMHATIAAFSSGVITVPISYSRKFEGLYGSVGYPYLINARTETTDSAYDLILNYINNMEMLSASQRKSLEIIKKYSEQFRLSIIDEITNKK